MRRAHIVLLLPLVLILSTAWAEGSEPSSRSSSIGPGLYDGNLELAEGKMTELSLRLLPNGGGLLDIPGQGLFGYPLSGLLIEGNHIVFTLGADSSRQWIDTLRRQGR